MKNRTESGTTTVDFLIIFLVLLVLGGLGAWNVHDHYQQSNELSVMVSLQLAVSAQEEFISQSGGYGSLGDLAGASTGHLPLDMGSGDGAKVHFKGYLFRFYLPEGEGMRDRWCAYAWPLSYPWTGRRSFFVNEGGLVHAAELQGLNGESPPMLKPGLAFQQGEPFGAIDTSQWRPVSEGTVF